jgi:hypothetical protein
MTDNKRAADDAEREKFNAWFKSEHTRMAVSPSFACKAWARAAWQAALSSRADGGKDSSDAVSQVATVLKDLIETLMLWNGQASAGLDVRGLSGLRDELNAAIAGEKK